MLTDQEIQAAYMTADSAELFARAIEQAVITKLAGVSVEPVASFWRERNQSLYPGIYIGLTTAGDALPLGERHKLYDATAIAAARVQENERCVQALEALWHSNDDSTKKCIDAIRTLIGAKHD